MIEPVTTRHPEWKCVACGWVMDASSCFIDPTATPKDGDFSLCGNCGAPYEFAGAKWEARRDNQIPAEIRSDIIWHRQIIKKVNKTDFAIDQELREENGR